jgi:hypothetical protein
VVRGAAALLGLPAVALAYFLAAPALPGLASGDLSTGVAGSIGLALIAACTLGVVIAREQPAAVALLVAGGSLVAGALVAAGAGSAANPFRAIGAAGIGILLARVLDGRRALVAIPLVVAGIDAWSVLGQGPASSLIAAQPQAVSYLVFDLPAWGSTPAHAGELGLADVVCLSMFACWTLTFGLRRWTLGLLALAPLLVLALSLTVSQALPVLPALAAALLLPNADRLAANA